MTTPPINTEIAVTQFLSTLKAGQVFVLQTGQTLTVLSRKQHKMQLQVTSLNTVTKINVEFKFGAWYNGLRAKTRTKAQMAFYNLQRNLEGEFTLNLVNAKNPLHTPTPVWQHYLSNTP